MMLKSHSIDYLILTLVRTPQTVKLNGFINNCIKQRKDSWKNIV